MPVSESTYIQVALEDPDGKWELHCGELRSKPPMTWAHSSIAWRLGFRLQQQLDLARFEVRVNAGRVRRSETQYYIPDVMVIPMEVAAGLFTHPQTLEVYPVPLPLIAEVWSPSTGGDLHEKLSAYRKRGDAEIWLMRPYECTLRVWRRQPDGSHNRSVVRDGTIRPIALPGVRVDLDELFALAEQPS